MGDYLPVFLIFFNYIFIIYIGCISFPGWPLSVTVRRLAKSFYICNKVLMTDCALKERLLSARL